uniref:Replicase n=1 Tax=Erysiphe necator associated abispo virus 8 TaxID=2741924 RepID=A0A8E3YJB2_9VIRU|nr:replicase [Erysiphe necator associated abispo virus 8]
MSDTSSVTDRSSSTAASSNSSTRSTGKTKFERDVEAALRRGVSECKNLLHWEVKRVADPEGGNTWTDAGIKDYRQILRIMSPGKAKCSCEKAACRWAWTGTWNHKGMFQTEYVPPGVEQKGIGEVTPGFSAKKMFPLDYGLTPDEFKFLNARFSEWYFVCNSSGSHDHPVAHTSTKIASRRLLDSLPVGTVDNPKVYIDLHGNPCSNEAFMRRVPGVVIITFVELITPKDYVRAATKWGPEFSDEGERRYWTTHIRDIPRDHPRWGAVVDGFISVHTTYYYDPQEIVNLLAWAKPGAKLWSLMHRFVGHNGTLNMGEQTWTKSPRGSQTLVKQVNVKSGECYEHPDNSWWFSHDSYAVGDGGMAWTTNLQCDETFKVTTTYCPAVACRMSTSCVQIAPLLPEKKHTTASAMTQEQIAQANRVTLSLYGVQTVMDIEPHLVPFFGMMRTTCIGKSRNAKNYADHVSRCKIKANSLMTTSGVAIDAQQLSDIARFSYFIDFEDQYGSDKLMFDQSYVTTLVADPLYKRGSGAITTGTLSLLTDMLMAAADCKNVKMGLMKAARAGVQHANRANVLNTL